MTTKNGCTKAETMTAAAMAAKLISTTSLCFQAGQTYATANEIELFELVASALATIAVIGAFLIKAHAGG